MQSSSINVFSSGSPKTGNDKISDKLSRHIAVVLNERQFLIRVAEKNYKTFEQMKRNMAGMQQQMDMMIGLMSDLMNMAQLQHNTFTFVKNYMNFMQLVKGCLFAMRQRHNVVDKNIQLIGPVLDNPLDRYYFKCLYGDEIRMS